MTTSERRRVWAVDGRVLIRRFALLCTVWIWDGWHNVSAADSRQLPGQQIQSLTVVGAARSKFCSLALLAGLPLGLGTDHSRCDTLQANSTASCISRVLSSTAVSTGAQPETDSVQAGDDWQV